MELTHDLPLDGLVSEVKAIKDSIQMLEDKLDNARCVGGWCATLAADLSGELFVSPAAGSQRLCDVVMATLGQEDFRRVLCSQCTL